VGKAAFETGNIAGAVAGMGSLTALPQRVLVILIGGLAAIALLLQLRVMTWILMGPVALMSIVFLVTVFFVPVDWQMAFRGLWITKGSR